LKERITNFIWKITEIFTDDRCYVSSFDDGSRARQGIILVEEGATEALVQAPAH